MALPVLGASDELDVSDIAPENRGWIGDVQKDPWKLAKAPEEIRAHKGVIMAVLKIEGSALEFASEELRADFDTVVEAVSTDAEALQFASPELQADMELARFAVATGWQALKHIAEEVRADKEFLLDQVQYKWFLAVYAAEQLRQDREFWLEVLRQDVSGWMAFTQYAPAQFLADKELVSEAIQNDILAFKFVAKELRSDHDFVMKVINEKSWVAVKDIEENLRGDAEIFFQAMRQDLDALTYASDELLEDEEFVRRAVEENPRTLMFCPNEKRRTDYERAGEAVRTNGLTLAYLAKNHRQDKDLINESIRTRLGTCSGLPWIIPTPYEGSDEAETDKDDEEEDVTSQPAAATTAIAHTAVNPNVS